VINKRSLKEARGNLRLKCDHKTNSPAGGQGLRLRKSHTIAAAAEGVSASRGPAYWGLGGVLGGGMLRMEADCRGLNSVMLLYGRLVYVCTSMKEKDGGRGNRTRAVSAQKNKKQAVIIPRPKSERKRHTREHKRRRKRRSSRKLFVESKKAFLSFGFFSTKPAKREGKSRGKEADLLSALKATSQRQAEMNPRPGSLSEIRSRKIGGNTANSSESSKEVDLIRWRKLTENLNKSEGS
jgi:hypothetical protein